MTVIKKIVPPIQHTDSAPFVKFLLSLLMRFKRYKQNGEFVRDGYVNCLRYADEISSRSLPPPALPYGINRKISHNYYYDRDARRSVQPPRLIGEDVLQLTSSKKDRKNAFISLPYPVPGVGYAWKRDASEELKQTKYDPSLKELERYDAK
ncbi:NADH dehydrogenase [ubiquinone] 1 alpha subcomplex subunit 7 [Trichinella pseudospiralis]|uniref:NADH dehydrogenase [ubiquinone] 1 alpha subcomplex subunit 7 n=1 Tax=Trichinella pseudospiralis TaxID=6337 RepID=A0A0V0Y9S2_TRIPS|nr:NADH dehydrogenase [ubiquinone] 1 alpha subcomplex subunit 7 [Trichinella pseudospiralis]